MEWLAGNRIALTPRPVRRRDAVLDVAMLGHCPGRVRLDRLLALTAVLDEMRGAGFGTAADRLERIADLLAAVREAGVERETRDALLTLMTRLADVRNAGVEQPADRLLDLPAGVRATLAGKGLADCVTASERLRQAWTDLRRAGLDRSISAALEHTAGALYHLPIPLRASAEFHDIFPDAGTAPTVYVSVLAGNRAWLGGAVEDFFANGGEKLWIVRVPEAEAQAGFLPVGDFRLHDPDSLRGLAAVLAIPSVAVVALPDLERLQVPARLPDVPRVRLENPDPQFLPCGQDLGDDHRERRYPSELAAMPAPWPLAALLLDDHGEGRPGLLSSLYRHRPDVQCLLTLPLAYSGELDSPAAEPAALAALAAIRDGGSGHVLRHVQFLFPYLRGPRYPLLSPAGLIAGQQSAVARRYGPWRSMAARPLVTDALPYPRLSLAEILKLRDEPGVGLLNYRSGRTALDDERLVVPALPPSDYADSIDRRRFDGFRAAEVMRFLGFLRRQLRTLGEQLVFDADYRDPRPRLLLESFLRRLHTLGALRGALPEDAFRIAESRPQEGALVFEIMLAPAFPIDRLLLTFTNLDGEWRTEVAGG